jgi:hypothetical protein
LSAGDLPVSGPGGEGQAEGQARSACGEPLHLISRLYQSYDSQSVQPCRNRRPAELQYAVRLDVRSVWDESTSLTPDGRIVCKPKIGTPPEQVRDQLTRVYGVYTMMYVALPRSLPDTIRKWVRTNQAEDLPTSLMSLESAILSQPSPRY